MPPAITKALTRVKETLAGFSVPQKTIAGIGIAVLVLGGIALSSWVSKPSLTPLFSGLEAEDAAAIVDQLNGSGVEYELTDNGRTILVPEEDVYTQRLAAASSGLPAGESGGYTLLDSMGVTSSEFQQSVTYKRAIEGELAKTISAMKGVKTAAVQLAIPEESVFVSEKENPTASVFLETASGKELSANQVDAIVHLTSAAVTGMTTADVAVIDQDGRTLSAIGVGTGSNSQKASEYEARIQDNVQKMLDKVLGPGNATVMVAAEMSNSNSERLAESYGPAEEGTPARDEKTSSETKTGGATTQAGVLGTEQVVDDTAAGDYSKIESTKNNPINKVVESTTTPAGALARQTIAVAVSRDAAGGVDAEQVEALVESAAGINDARGDRVTVEFLAFNNQAAQDAEEALAAERAEREAAEAAELMQTAIIGGSVVLVAAGAGVTWLLITRRRKKAAAEAEEAAAAVAELASLAHSDTETEDVVELATASVEPAAAIEISEVDMDAEVEPTQVTIDRRRVEVSNFAKNNPMKAAEHLRTIIRNGPEQ